MSVSSITAPSKSTASDRHYQPLVLLALLITAPFLLIAVPSSEWGAVTIYLFVLALVAVILYQYGIKPLDSSFSSSLYLLTVLVKLLGTLLRYWSLTILYDGFGDAIAYHEHGQILTQYFKVFDFSIMNTYRIGDGGTTWLTFITGFIYSVLPASMAGGFLFFAMLAFIGSVLFYRAVRVAWPTVDSSYYRLCIFFVPSILFWPSSLGKDAWLFFCSGLIFWGWTSFLSKRNWFSLVWIVSGLLLVNLIRPHFAAFLAIGMGAGYLLTSIRGQSSIIHWLIGAVAVSTLVIYMVQSGSQFLKLDEFSLDNVETQMERVQGLTTQGGSRYETVSIFTPWGFIWGLITTLVRPFPWEARNPQVLVTALETSGWLLLAWLQRRVLLKKLRTLFNDPILSFALFYMLISLLALTSIGNFGILARQRVLILPFIWMLFV